MHRGAINSGCGGHPRRHGRSCHGPGRGAEALGFVTPGGLVTIDTYLLSVVLDYGVMGFMLFFGMMFAAFLLMVRLAITLTPGPSPQQREASFVLPLCAMLAAFFMIKTVLSQEENHAILFMAYGAVTVLAYRARGSQIPPPRKTYLVGRGGDA